MSLQYLNKSFQRYNEGAGRRVISVYRMRWNVLIGYSSGEVLTKDYRGGVVVVGNGVPRWRGHDDRTSGGRVYGDE